MLHRITVTENAERQFKTFSARDQKSIADGIAKRLLHEPTKESKAIKKLRTNPFAEFELRLGKFRVLYNVHVADPADPEVILLLFGEKVGNRLIVEGVEFHEHEGDPPN